VANQFDMRTATLEPALSPPAIAGRGGRGRRTVAIVAYVAAALFVAAGGWAFALTRPAPATLRLALPTGSVRSYRVALDLNGGPPKSGSGRAFTLRVDELLSWLVTSVDAAHVATVVVRSSNVTTSLNGGAALPVAPVTAVLEVGPDGRVLSARDPGILTGGLRAALTFPGLSQLTPFISKDVVKPGASWSGTARQAYPLGTGSIGETLIGRYVGSAGQGRSLVETTQTSVLGATLFIRRLHDASGAFDPSGLPPDTDPQIAYGGTVATTQIAAVDAAGRLLAATERGTFDVTMQYSGFPQIFPTFSPPGDDLFGGGPPGSNAQSGVHVVGTISVAFGPA